MRERSTQSDLRTRSKTNALLHLIARREFAYPSDSINLVAGQHDSLTQLKSRWRRLVWPIAVLVVPPG